MHVLLWWLDDKPLDREATASIADPTGRVLVSMATAWEIAINQGQGRLRVRDDFLEVLAEQGMDLLGIEPAHARAVRDLPLHHQDPFDRMLVAQAQVEDATLVTRDRRLARYDVRLLEA